MLYSLLPEILAEGPTENRAATVLCGLERPPVQKPNEPKSLRPDLPLVVCTPSFKAATQ